jgi:hypothetical protein
MVEMLTIEQRVSELEKEVARLKQDLSQARPGTLLEARGRLAGENKRLHEK